MADYQQLMFKKNMFPIITMNLLVVDFNRKKGKPKDPPQLLTHKVQTVRSPSTAFQAVRSSGHNRFASKSALRETFQYPDGDNYLKTIGVKAFVIQKEYLERLWLWLVIHPFKQRIPGQIRIWEAQVRTAKSLVTFPRKYWFLKCWFPSRSSTNKGSTFYSQLPEVPEVPAKAWAVGEVHDAKYLHGRPNRGKASAVHPRFLGRCHHGWQWPPIHQLVPVWSSTSCWYFRWPERRKASETETSPWQCGRKLAIWL